MILIFFVYFLTFLTFVLSEQKLDYTNQENYDIWTGTCNSKTSQSPIDLPDNDDCIQSTDYVQILSTNYPLINDKNVSFVHGYSFAIEFGDEGKQALTVKINETTLVYDLKNIHFHFPLAQALVSFLTGLPVKG
jgi:carbonic anhydrase